MAVLNKRAKYTLCKNAFLQGIKYIFTSKDIAQHPLQNNIFTSFIVKIKDFTEIYKI
jgi:hypothetical protein